MIEEIATKISSQVGLIDKLMETTNGHKLSTQAGKLAILLEQLLEHKADAKKMKNASYAEQYDKYKAQGMSQGDAKVYADAKKDATYEMIEALESGVKSVLSTVKDKLHWLELENFNKNF